MHIVVRGMVSTIKKLRHLPSSFVPSEAPHRELAARTGSVILNS